MVLRAVVNVRPARPNAMKTGGQLKVWRRKEPRLPAIAVLEEEGEEEEGE